MVTTTTTTTTTTKTTSVILIIVCEICEVNIPISILNTVFQVVLYPVIQRIILGSAAQIWKKKVLYLP
jgi:hypothetical protein